MAQYSLTCTLAVAKLWNKENHHTAKAIKGRRIVDLPTDKQAGAMQCKQRVPTGSSLSSCIHLLGSAWAAWQHMNAQAGSHRFSSAGSQSLGLSCNKLQSSSKGPLLADTVSCMLQSLK